ncbi:MAG TPA: hypothetical protein VGE97_08010 [Nitrososphaera sp.]|jgi:hypothetical protein
MSYLEKLLSNQTESIHRQYFDKLRDLPFWIRSKEDHATAYKQSKPFCCFNHAVGLPEKNGRVMGIFDYQMSWFDTLMTDTGSKYFWLKKSTGIGATTFFLRWMTWLATCNDGMKANEMAIVVGPNIDLAVGLMNKIRQLFIPHGIVLDSKQTEITINDCMIKAYPSNHLDAMRSRMDLKVIFSDESDFYEPGERAILHDVIERYIARSDPWIILVSTPAGPDGLFAQMEAEEHSIYQRVKIDYRAGLGKIYSHEEIEHVRKSPSFAREYECQYLGLVGNVFKPEDIQACIKLGSETYDPNVINGRTPKVIAMDPAWGRFISIWACSY